MTHPALTNRKIFSLWFPMASAWIMMAVEGPFLAALIARLADPKYNLAAFGVALSIAMFAEAPIIMIMSASTALVKNQDSYHKLKRFTWFLNIMITGLLLLILIPGLFFHFTIQWVGLPPEVARMAHRATIFFLPWPASIGYRRFFQGILINHHLTRRVAYGTAVRLSTMSITAIVLYVLGTNGALLGAIALSAGVFFEALASRFMARKIIPDLKNKPAAPGEQLLTYKEIVHFYFPLALTSMLVLGVQPIVTFFMGRGRFALESLAVFPVVNSFSFLFRSFGISYQEVSITLMGVKNEGYRPLRKFALLSSLLLVGVMSLISFTPLLTFWYQTVSGLSSELTHFADLPTKILILLPALIFFISLQRAALVHIKKTQPIIWATGIEIMVLVFILFLTIPIFHMVGATGAAIAFTLAPIFTNLYLFFKLKKHFFQGEKAKING